MGFRLVCLSLRVKWRAFFFRYGLFRAQVKGFRFEGFRFEGFRFEGFRFVFASQFTESWGS